ncbi:26S proteasome non-ATPase regulatory subunit 3 homolog A [Tanacetum coccineum]
MGWSYHRKKNSRPLSAPYQYKNYSCVFRFNVIRTGLRNISISYSRISLADVATKLRLDSPNPIAADAESIVSKAIRDGAIDATIDHANGWMLSKETGDIYSTNEPQMAFNSRIAFCLNMHNEAVRALRFPPNSHKEKESAEKRRERDNNRSKNLLNI